MQDIGKLLFFVGLGIAAIGAALWLGLGKGWLGRLPGDVVIERQNVSFYFPIVTCVVISLILTLLLWILRR